jgi:asparagine synthase (glutamine-hydrolysing)
MSGICGLLNLDEAPVAEATIMAMTAMLERRGPERTGLERDGPIGVGHTLLATTPELLFERQPLRHWDTRCIITADVQLHNRPELLRLLGLEEIGDSIGDAELILRAYLNWGEHCLDRLLGDFAFAIWDPRKRKLLCARDHFGMRPFYYHYAHAQRFLFASDPRAILVLPQVPYHINEGRIADFLVPQLERIDLTSTFYEDVFRLPPGHKASVTANGMEIVEYWKPVPGPDLPPMSDEEYAEGFLEVFAEAVDERLRTPSGTVCSMLSGGIDSGSIVAVAKELLASRGIPPLPTYSAVRQDVANCSETQAIHAATAMPSVAPNLVKLDAVMESFVEQLVPAIEEPFDAEMTLIQCIYRAAQGNGHRVVLDGMSGDVVLAEGTYIVRLIRQGQLGLAFKETVAENRFWCDAKLSKNLIRHGRAALVPEAVKKRLKGLGNSRRAREILSGSAISTTFAARIEIQERLTQLWRTLGNEWSADYAVERCQMIRPSVTAGRERYARVAAAVGAEARDSFLDKRVVDYCSRLPGRLLLRDGWPKFILREVMAGKLPEEVRWQRGKPHLGWRFNRAVTKSAIDRGDISLERLKGDLEDYVDPDALSSAWLDIHSGGDGEHIHSAYVLSVWLRENAERPRVQD